MQTDIQIESLKSLILEIKCKAWNVTDATRVLDVFSPKSKSL